MPSVVGKLLKFGQAATGNAQFDGKKMEKIFQKFLEKNLKLDPEVALLEDSACKTYAGDLLTRNFRMLTYDYLASCALHAVRPLSRNFSEAILP